MMVTKISTSTSTSTSSSSSSSSSWLHRPAILWDPKLVVSAQGGSCGSYWIHEAIGLLQEEQKAPTSTDNNNNCTNTNNLYMVSYLKLLSTAAKIVAKLRQELISDHEMHHKEHHQQQRHQQFLGGIPVAVAIPEGPLLPLAILVVHALNHQSMMERNSNVIDNANNYDYDSPFAILVPIEPGEAKERNRHILNDVRPDKILAVPGRDMDRLQEILLTSSKTSDESPSSSSSVSSSYPENMFPQSCEVVDFASLVREILHNEDKPKSSSDVSRMMRLEQILSQEWVQKITSLSTLVSICVDAIEKECENIEKVQEKWKDHRLAILSASYDTAMMPPPLGRRVSHIVYTSGTTGLPKGCISSMASLQHYLQSKNQVYSITKESRVLLASALSFDPCLSDILATFQAKATLVMAPRGRLLDSLSGIVQTLNVTHVLCTPTLWSLMDANNSMGARPKDFPHLQVVALGGEPIPKRILQTWARNSKKCKEGNNGDSPGRKHNQCRLFATYGVTEACVYQTCGEVFLEDSSPSGGTGTGTRQQLLSVGKPFAGLGVRICKEEVQESLVNVSHYGETGEVVLYGAQLDECTGYLNRPELGLKFVDSHKVYHYRTGDRGILDPDDGMLRILGRITGEEGMVKINGVRVELGEIESTLIDGSNTENDTNFPVVVSCLAKFLKNGESDRTEIQAFCVLGDTTLRELGIESKDGFPMPGFFIRVSPLLTLLRARCEQNMKAACIPRSLIAIPSLPLSPTGKRDRNGLPDIANCVATDHGDQAGVPLKEYRSAGAVVAENIIDCLNLQSSQESMLTTTVTFSMLGGDSLAATRLTRALYAYHHQVFNTRYLGGAFGMLGEPFEVAHLLRARSLGDYVDMLEEHNIGVIPNSTVENDDAIERSSLAGGGDELPTEDNGQVLYDALLQATTLGQSSIASALLEIGANPNHGQHGGRLGKNTDRNEQKATFRSSPLHLACLKGDCDLVKHLLDRSAKYNSPDASGLYPLHLAASGMDSKASCSKANLRRLECVKLLLKAGTPLTIRDGNKQSVLHAAARAGNSRIIEYVMTAWKEKNGESVISPANKHFFNLNDRWFRTPVHWAVLNGRVDAVRTLLKLGCSASPPKPKANNRSSAAVESPMEMVERVYSDAKGKGAEIKQLLKGGR